MILAAGAMGGGVYVIVTAKSGRTVDFYLLGAVSVIGGLAMLLVALDWVYGLRNGGEDGDGRHRDRSED